MASILTLLMAAVQLLTIVQGNPNLPQSFRDQAVAIANYSIEVANVELVKLNTVSTSTAPAPVTPTPPPTLGSITVPPTPTQQPMPEVSKEIRVVYDNTRTNQNGVYYDVYAFYLEDGQYKSDVDITFSSDDDGTFVGGGKAYNKTGVARTRMGSGTTSNPAAHFQFTPKDVGERTIAVTANGVSATVKAPGQN